MVRLIISVVVFFCTNIFFYSSTIVSDKFDYIRKDEKGNCIVITNKEGKYGVVDLFGKEIIEPKYSYVSYTQDSLFWVNTDNTYGILDIQGQVLLPIEYDQPISYLKGDYYLLSKTGRYGVFDRNNKRIVIPPLYDKIVAKDYNEQEVEISKPKALSSHKSILVYSKKESGLYQSLIDLESGVPIIEEGVYDDIKPSDKFGYIVVSKKGKQGIIDYNLNEIIPLQDSTFSIGRFGFLASSNHKKQFVSNHTLVKSKPYDEVVMYSNGCSCVTLGNNFGVINSDGKEIIPVAYDDVYLSINNVETNYITTVEYLRHGEEQNQYCFFDLDGNKLSPKLTHKHVEYFYKQAVFVVENSDNKQGLVNEKGIMLLPLNYRRIYVDDDLGIARLEMDDYEMGLANTKGKILLKPKYNDMSSFVRGVAEVGLQTKNEYLHGLIDSEGNEILKPQFSSIFFNLDKEKEYATVYYGSKMGVISREGRIIVEPRYDDIIYQDRSDDDWGYLAIIKQNGNYGLINLSSGEIIQEPINKYIYATGAGDTILFCIRTDNGNYFIDKRGKVIIPVTDDLMYPIRSFENDFLVLKKGEKLGVIDRYNQKIIPCVYDKVELLKDNLFKVEKDGKVGILNKLNESIFPLEFDFIECYLYQNTDLFFAKRGMDYGYIFLDKGTFEISPIAKDIYESITQKK